MHLISSDGLSTLNAFGDIFENTGNGILNSIQNIDASYCP